METPMNICRREYAAVEAAETLNVQVRNKEMRATLRKNSKKDQIIQ